MVSVNSSPCLTRTCNTLQHTATHCNTLHHTATHCITLQHTATHPGTGARELKSLHSLAPCNILQHTTTRCNTPQHTQALAPANSSPCIPWHPATHHNALQHTATHRNTPRHWCPRTRVLAFPGTQLPVAVNNKYNNRNRRRNSSFIAFSLPSNLPPTYDTPL